VSGGPERHRIGLEIDVERDRIDVEPGEWDVEDLMGALRSGAARPRRVIRGRVSDEEHDPLSVMLREWAEDLEAALQLHWLASASPDAVIRAPEGSPRPSLETLVELRALADQARRLARRLSDERL
jgi:hypothetical protein